MKVGRGLPNMPRHAALDASVESRLNATHTAQRRMNRKQRRAHSVAAYCAPNAAGMSFKLACRRG
jgi:hypothetical protein